MTNTTINAIPAVGAELDEAQLATISGGMRDRGRSSKVIDVVDGWTGTDADF
ncbi:putative ATP-grasp target RiPP [Prescottella agglutinans]|uniref:putative ATP-grasp target RiPP n=1 Tax=Prescottella agglutinans TaxID=1644129 RepID=UPI003D97A663